MNKINFRTVIKLYNISYFDYLFLFIRSFFLDYKSISKYVPKNSTILDIGCGHGFLSNYLSLCDSETSVFGIDIDLKRINIANSTIGNRKNIKFDTIDIDCIDFKNYFVVLIIDVLHYMPFAKQTEIIKTIGMKLPPKSLLIIRDVDTKPKLKFLWNFFHEFLMTKFSFTKSKNSSLFFRSSIETAEILKNSGFEVQLIPNSSILPYTDTLFICIKS